MRNGFTLVELIIFLGFIACILLCAGVGGHFIE